MTDLFSRATFFSIPEYISRKKVKFSQTGRKDEKNSLLHRIPNLIVSVIFALHDPSGSHTTMAKVLRRIRKRFPEIGHWSVNFPEKY